MVDETKPDINERLSWTDRLANAWGRQIVGQEVETYVTGVASDKWSKLYDLFRTQNHRGLKYNSFKAILVAAAAHNFDKNNNSSQGWLNSGVKRAFKQEILSLLEDLPAGADEQSLTAGIIDAHIFTYGDGYQFEPEGSKLSLNSTEVFALGGMLAEVIKEPQDFALSDQEVKKLDRSIRHTLDHLWSNRS